MLSKTICEKCLKTRRLSVCKITGSVWSCVIWDEVRKSMPANVRKQRRWRHRNYVKLLMCVDDNIPEGCKMLFEQSVYGATK